MLEYDVTELDQDFMTLWSSYLLSGNMDFPRLTALAELGQINAVQSYYLFANTNQSNAKIDAIIDDYSAADPHQLLARLHRLSYENVVNGIPDGPELKRLYHQNVIDLCTLYDRTQNPLLLVQANEVATCDDLLAKSAKKQMHALAGKGLWQQFRNEAKGVGADRTEPATAVKFALGKHLVLFTPNNVLHKNEKKLGVELLTAIANRSYSPELAVKLSAIKPAPAKLSRCVVNGVDPLRAVNSPLDLEC